MPVAPSGMGQVHLADGSVTNANETAMNLALSTYARNHNKNDISSMKVLGFTNASHGNSIATLSVSDPAVNSNNYPTYDWPRADLQKMVYPFSPNQEENLAREQECMANVRSIVAQSREDNADVAGIIIEPISAFENRQATPMFYKHLRAFAQAEGIPFIVDETRVGMGITGKMWAHEHWYLSERDGGAPDIVTFGGRAGISGFYSTKAYAVDAHAEMEQNVNMVDVLNYGVTWRAIQDNNLLDWV